MLRFDGRCVESWCVPSTRTASLIFSLSFWQVPQRKSRQVPEDKEAESKMPGLWSVWGTWSACSQPCGLGVSERARTCQSPYQQVPWAGRTELAPQPSYSDPPSYQEERAASPYPARPAYPLHADRPIRPALSFRSNSGSTPTLHGRLQPPRPRYSPQNRYTRHETFPADALPPPVRTQDAITPHFGPRKDLGSSREAVQLSRPQRNQLDRETPPSHAFSQRLPYWETSGTEALSSRHSSLAWRPSRESIPLFKPMRPDSHEIGLNRDGPRHGSQADSSQYGWAASPTQESPAARRYVFGVASVLRMLNRR